MRLLSFDDGKQNGDVAGPGSAEERVERPLGSLSTHHNQALAACKQLFRLFAEGRLFRQVDSVVEFGG